MLIANLEATATELETQAAAWAIELTPDHARVVAMRQDAERCRRRIAVLRKMGGAK